MKTVLAAAALLAATAAMAQYAGQPPSYGQAGAPPPNYGNDNSGYGPPPYGQPSPGYGAPRPDATNNAGYPRPSDDRGGYRGRPQAEFFVDDDFRGRSIMLDHPIRRLGPTGMEDKISSIGIRSGVWLVCEDDDFRGRCVTIDHSIARLSEIGMDDRISSIRPLRPREGPRY